MEALDIGLPNRLDEVKWTERMLLDRLRARYSVNHGNGPEWVFMEHVADQTGFANRRIDGMAVHLWRSRHHEVHAFEVKVSRGDFRRELADMSKSEVWTSWVEHFWIVAPHGVLTKADIPDQWGLLVTRGSGLAVAKRAPRLRPKPAGYLPAGDLPRSVVAAMLRQAARLPAPAANEGSTSGRMDR
jgi:hypothetical protein